MAASAVAAWCSLLGQDWGHAATDQCPWVLVLFCFRHVLFANMPFIHVNRLDLLEDILLVKDNY